MAKFFFSLSLCLVLLFNICLARQYIQQQNECQLDRLEAVEPDTRIESEAGTIESWNPNQQQFQCAGVAVVRRIIEPKGLLLPHYSNAPQLVYIIQGRGMTGALFPGCAETFQESQGSGGSSRVLDQHQKIRHFRQGDIIAIPAGVAHWCYNDGHEPVVAVYVLDTANSNNQLDMNPRHFYLAGNPEDEFRQLYERGGQHARHEAYTSRRGQRERRYCNNLFCGMDPRLVAEAFNIDIELARKLQSEHDFRNSIISVEGKLEVVRPPRTQQEKEEQQERGRTGYGGPINGFEETVCSMRMIENIANPSQADVFIPDVGRLSTVNSHNLPILSEIQLSASFVNLRRDAVRLPHWHMNCHSVVYIIKGRGRVQVSDEFGNTVFDGSVREGQLFTVPQNFLVVKEAESDRFQYISFNTNENAMTNDVAGRTSVVRALPVEVVATAFRVSFEDARRIKFRREETTFGTRRPRSGRRDVDDA